MGVEISTILAWLTEAQAATAEEYTETPFWMNAASSKIKTDTAEIPREAFSPDERACTIQPLNN